MLKSKAKAFRFQSTLASAKPVELRYMTLNLSVTTQILGIEATSNEDQIQIVAQDVSQDKAIIVTCDTLTGTEVSPLRINAGMDCVSLDGKHILKKMQPQTMAPVKPGRK